MRIVDLWDLENKPSVRKSLGESLASDILSIAQERYKYDNTQKFKVEFRLLTIDEPYI